MNLINKLSDFIGKKEVKDTLQVYIDACNKLNKPLDHCLLYGLPGTGKTTLAKIIANELNTKIKITQGSMVQKPIDVINLLLSLNQNEILFIDEIHAVNKQCFELFYSAMEEGYVDIAIGKDFNSKMARIKLPVFTLIAATTNLGKIPQPLEDRFGIFINMSEYSKTEISDIIKFYGNKLGVIFSNDDLLTLEGVNRDKHKVKLLLKTLTRNESTTVTNSTLRKDIKEIDNEDIDIDTVASYLNAFDKLFLLDNDEPFSTNIRSSIRVKQSEKRHFADPSISCALLNLTQEKLISDLETFGFLFEAMVERDLKIYANFTIILCSV